MGPTLMLIAIFLATTGAVAGWLALLGLKDVLGPGNRGRG